MLADIRRIIGLAWPVLVGQLAIIAFGVTDTAMVGRFSATDLAALGLGASIYLSVFIGLTGILSALQPITGQLYGARRYAEIGEEVRQALWLAALLAVPGFLLLHFPEPLLRLAHAPAALHERTVAYLRLLSFGLPASLVFRIYGALTNAAGKPRLAMILQIGALALKFPLNVWFIFGGFGVPALGGPGCGLASTVINWALALVGFTLLAKLDVFAPLAIFSRFCWPVWARQKAILKLGVPMGLSYLIEVTSFTCMALFIAQFGTTTLAGHQIAANISGVLYMTPLSIGVATSTLVARALGAGQPDEARLLGRHGVTLAGGIAALYGLLVFALRPLIVGGYTPNPAVAAAAMPLVAIVTCYHFFDALQVTSAFALRAYKVAAVPTIIYAVALWGVGLGGGYLLGFDVGGYSPAWLTGARGFWFANTMSLMLAGAGLALYLRHVSRVASRAPAPSPEPA
ncbi:MATE family efflux transporter [Burkholderia ubonensis]|uniref:MATE family efflux transporter n=1 Tax=Burkholderia ubonensis TaxID=101571 RepID=UPI00075E22A8|nr:MATE family efflux transporter [Burkholderia ubonensis]KVM05000.1 MATE family efflux transporter [Burkholderia ubonensis]KVM07067.1 MATE family efflux transporter [Burkholderia ubonensis]KVM51801.1 MATE family efflux transporter [Burkholderia ubonensis]KVR13989.1 MATE family efflux transporter [Burkholderia ubonensis]KVT81058.1 MATE family efflux transporter [Burkholderia ubonensis]